MRIFTLTLVAGLAIFSLAVNTSTGLHAKNGGNLLLNEISPWPSDDVVWVEFINPTDEPVTLDGWTVEFLSGFSYTFPRDAGEVDGGNLHLLNISGGNPLNPTGDGCILSSPDGPVDAITWGIPGQFPDISLNVGIPVNPPYGFIGANRELHEADDVIFRLPLSWESASLSLVGSSHWVYRSGDAASQGAENPPPPPVYYSPSDGAYVASDFMLVVEGFGWTTETTFQVATDEQFQNIVIEETVDGYSLLIDDLDGGTYFWRVRGSRDETGPWTQPLELTRASFNIEDLIEEFDNSGRTSEFHESSEIRLAQHKGGIDPDVWLTGYHMVPMTQDTQRKDTMMICMDGCNMNGTYPWDNPQPINDDSTASHGNGYCGMASLKMMASADGCSLSQDRIAYYMDEEAGTASHSATLKGQIGNPWMDLNHGTGGGLYSEDCPLMVSWLYNQPASASKEVFYNLNTFYDNTPAMDSIAEFIADNRPVLRHSPGHTTCIGGVGQLQIEGIGEINFIQVYETNVMGNIMWMEVDSASITFNEFTYPPTTGRMTRNDEPEIWQDSDEDGLVDFDETQRLHTDPNDNDTDGDGVHDKEDMLGYLFFPDGYYLKGERDFDNDGSPKELDSDNDDPADNSAMDGCEDVDLDGFQNPESNETNCFNVSDDYDNVNPDCFRGYIRMDVGVDAAGPDYTVHYKYYEMVIIEAGEIDTEAFNHQHMWDYTFEYFFPDGQATAYHNDKGDARVRLDYEPSTMEYFLMIESTTPMLNLPVDVQYMMMQRIIIPPPSIYWFDRDERWPLGQAEVVNGGLLVKGEWDLSPHLFTWEIWVEPPTQ